MTALDEFVTRLFDPRDDLNSLSLSDLGQRALAEYEQTASHINDALHHFIAFGDVLLVARSRVPDGEWIAWLQSIGIYHYETAARATRLAFHKDALPPEAFTVWEDRSGRSLSPSINRALRYVRGLPDATSRSGGGYDDETRREAERLRKGGLTYAAISEILGVGKTTVRCWCDPDYQRRVREQNRRRRKRDAAARLALKRAEARSERDALAKATRNPDISDSYSLVRKLAVALDKSMTSASIDVSPTLREALSRCHKCEEEIVQAMRAERARDQSVRVTP